MAIYYVNSNRIYDAPQGSNAGIAVHTPKEMPNAWVRSILEIDPQEPHKSTLHLEMYASDDEWKVPEEDLSVDVLFIGDLSTSKPNCGDAAAVVQSLQYEDLTTELRASAHYVAGLPSKDPVDQPISPDLTNEQQAQERAEEFDYGLMTLPMDEELENEGDDGRKSSYAVGEYDCRLDASPLVQPVGTETIVTTPHLWAGRAEKVTGLASHFCVVSVVKSTLIHAPRTLSHEPLRPGDYAGCQVTSDQLASYGNQRSIESTDEKSFSAVALASETSILMDFSAEKRQQMTTFFLGVLLGTLSGLMASSAIALATSYRQSRKVPPTDSRDPEHEDATA
ncbi:hypothetical protein [Ornithinicoccus hortensis]|nr:hypothetical protein [Ornithinicoccus hortensis]